MNIVKKSSQKPNIQIQVKQQRSAVYSVHSPSNTTSPTRVQPEEPSHEDIKHAETGEKRTESPSSTKRPQIYTTSGQRVAEEQYQNI
jgi:hypothetical protein